MKNVIEVKNFSFGYQNKDGGNLPVLRDLNLGIKPGEFVSVIGPSGCGKTTLLLAVAGLLAGGEGGISIKGKIATVFQNDCLFPWRSLESNVAYGLEIEGKSRERRRTIAEKNIKLVGLEGFEKYYPRQLSGGMRQRVNLARAMAVDPDIILMDEPFASLDAQTRERIQEELLGIWVKHKKTVVFVTHQIEEAVFLSDRIIVFSKRPAEVLKSIEINLKRPRTAGIRESVKFVEYERELRKLVSSSKSSM